MADTIKVVCAAPAWAGNTAYSLQARVANDTGKIYECITAGTSAASGGPTGTASDITDGTAHWKYVVTSHYSSLAAWEAGQQKSISAGNREIADCYGGASDTASLTISGWTTVATGYVLIRVPTAERHNGKWNTGKYYLSVSNSAAMVVSEEYVRIDGLQAEVSSGNADAQHTIRVAGILAGSYILISNSISRTHANTSYLAHALFVNDSDAVTDVWNCVLHHRALNSSGLSYACWINGNATSRILNCTCYGGVRALRLDNDAITVTNVIAAGATGGAFYRASASLAISYSASDDATADDWGGAGNRINQTFSFVDSANTDFHLASNDAGAKDHGTDLSSTFTDDIDGQTRSGTWDIGADEYQASTTTVGNTRSISWDVRGHIGNARAVSWSVRSRANTTRQASWAVRSKAGNTRVNSWSVRKLASNTRQPSWAARAKAANTRAASWSVRKCASTTRQSSWSVRNIAGANRALLWNVQSAISYSQVGNARAASWTVRKKTGNTRASSWSVRCLIPANRGLSFAVRRAVGTARVQTWSVRATVTGPARNLAWSVRSTIGNTKVPSWDQRAATTSSRVLVWNILPQSSQYNPLILGQTHHGSDLVMIMPDVGLSMDSDQTNLLMEVTT